MKLTFENLEQILSETEESYIVGQDSISLKWNNLSKIAKYAGFDLPATKKTLEFHDLMSPLSPYTCIHSKVYNETIPGPALVERNEKGQIHSLDGPAVIWVGRRFKIYEYWVNGLPVNNNREERKFVSREDIAWASSFKRNQNYSFLTEEDREKERKYNNLCMEYFVKDSRSPEPRGIDPRAYYLAALRKSFTNMNQDLYSLLRFVEEYNHSKHLCSNNQMFVLNMNSFIDKLGCRGAGLSYGWTLTSKYSDNTIGTNKSITGDY